MAQRRMTVYAVTRSGASAARRRRSFVVTAFHTWRLVPSPLDLASWHVAALPPPAFTCAFLLAPRTNRF